MLDAYGLEQETRSMQAYRLFAARSSYEAHCAKRGLAADWDGLDGTDRHLWLMTADAMTAWRFSREIAIAC